MAAGACAEGEVTWACVLWLSAAAVSFYTSAMLFMGHSTTSTFLAGALGVVLGLCGNACVKTGDAK